MTRSCINCEWQAVYKAQRCAACYWWKRRHHGQERPEDQIVKHGARVLDATRKYG